MTDLEILFNHLRTFESAVLGYSGGVDSALLAVAATRVLGSERFLAVIGRSASYPAFQADTAERLARTFNIPLLDVEAQRATTLPGNMRELQWNLGQFFGDRDGVMFLRIVHAHPGRLQADRRL